MMACFLSESAYSAANTSGWAWDSGRRMATASSIAARASSYCSTFAALAASESALGAWAATCGTASLTDLLERTLSILDTGLGLADAPPASDPGRPCP